MVIIQKITFNGKISDYIIISDWTKKKKEQICSSYAEYFIHYAFKLNFPM